MNATKTLKSIAAVAIVIMLIALASSEFGRPDDLDMQQATYCQMVKTFKATNGQYGWPDYNGNAAEVCQ